MVPNGPEAVPVEPVAEMAPMPAPAAVEQVEPLPTPAPKAVEQIKP